MTNIEELIRTNEELRQQYKGLLHRVTDAFFVGLSIGIIATSAAFIVFIIWKG